MPHSAGNLLIRAAFRHQANYRIAQILEALGPLLRLPIQAWVRASPTPPGQWRRGLLIGADHIGDVLCRTSALPDLAAATPGCAWSYLASRPANELLETNPFLDRVVVLKRELHKTKAAELRALMKGCDAVICYDLIGTHRLLAIACAAQAPNRIAFAHKGFSWLATRPLPLLYPSPYASTFRDMVAEIAGRPLSAEPRPLVYPTSEDESLAREAFSRLGQGPGVPVLACSIFTRQGSGGYPPELYIETVRRVQAQARVHAVFLASTAERKPLESLLEGSGLDYSVVTGLPLRSLHCFLRQCQAAFAMDSGVRHLANAAAIPVVFTRNWEMHPVEAGPYLATETAVPLRSLFNGASPPSGSASTFDPAGAAQQIREALEKKP